MGEHGKRLGWTIKVACLGWYRKEARKEPKLGRQKSKRKKIDSEPR